MTDKATDAVLQRVDELALSKAELGRATGMSFKTISRLLDERVLPTRLDKRRDLSLGLRWPADAIERLLAGDDPAELESNDGHPQRESARPSGDVEQRLTAVESDLAEVRRGVEELLRRVPPEGAAP